MTYQASDAAAHAPEQGGGWLLPVIGGSILTLLWGAYTLMVVIHIVMLPLPAL